MNRTEIESDVDRKVGKTQKPGLWEHLLAWHLFAFAHPVDVRCPKCQSLLVVIPFANAEAATIECDCGMCNGALRDL